MYKLLLPQIVADRRKKLRSHRNWINTTMDWKTWKSTHITTGLSTDLWYCYLPFHKYESYPSLSLVFSTEYLTRFPLSRWFATGITRPICKKSLVAHITYQRTCRVRYLPVRFPLLLRLTIIWQPPARDKKHTLSDWRYHGCPPFIVCWSRNPGVTWYFCNTIQQ